MKHYKKTVLGSIVAFFVGTSCCWLSSLAIWLGGATILGVISNWVENFQVQIIILGVLLAMVSMFLYKKRRSQ